MWNITTVTAFSALKMSNFIPKKDHLRKILKKCAPQTYRKPIDSYGEDAPSPDTCERLFDWFKTSDFDTTKKIKLQCCKHCYTKIPLKFNHNWQKYKWLEKVLTSIWMWWKRFEKKKNWYHTISVKDRRRIKKSQENLVLKTLTE